MTGGFNDAWRALHGEELVCPHCGATNLPNAKPTIEVDRGTANCAACGHGWKVETAA
jgi:transcription elongation factor Elf1